MKDVQQNVPYELEYWKNTSREKARKRYVCARHLLRPYALRRSAIDLGSGPYGGIFMVMKFPVMVAIDPLWPRYLELGYEAPEGVEIVAGHSGDFCYDGKVDLIFSMNALDHSGDLAAAGREIAAHLRPEGEFILHVHLRTKKQLNAGHKMLLTEESVRAAFSNMTLQTLHTTDICPFDGKPYRSLVGLWEK